MNHLEPSPVGPAGINLSNVPVTLGVLRPQPAVKPVAVSVAPTPIVALVPPVQARPTFTKHSEKARRAAELTAYQYDLALTHMFRLEPFAVDLPMIAAARRNHPELLAHAQTIVTAAMGKPKQFAKNALRLFSDSPISKRTRTPKITKNEWAHLHHDIVDVTLSELLAAEGGTDQDTIDALSRSWEHIAFTGQLGTALSTPVFRLRMIHSEAPAALPQAA